MKPRIPVAAPALVGREKEYVLDCLESSWISSNGKYIGMFEEGFAAFCGARHGIACCNGTVALHVALLALGVGPGDEVIVPTLTFVATANAVTYCGARPVFVDSEPVTGNLDPDAVEAGLSDRTKAIVVVHLYGHPADIDPILALARRRGVAVVEDAAEAHGAEYRGRRVGSLADVACFSFYGNKIITTGEGGMVVCDRDDLAARVRLLRGQGQDPARRYWFPLLGYNYRMTNICAAIGLAQLERVGWHVERRRTLAAWYREELAGLDWLRIAGEEAWARSSFWMVCASLVEGGRDERDAVMRHLDAGGVETRPFFYPLHTLPIYAGSSAGDRFPVAEALAERGLNLPTSSLVSREDVARIGASLRELRW